MPIYEYYCDENHTIYQFYAKTLAQGQLTPRCPDDPSLTLKKVLSSFAINSGGRKGETGDSGIDDPNTDTNPAEDSRIEAAMGAMEQEFSNADENDPRAMARMMRRMAEMTGEKIDGEMEEVVRKLEEGADPDTLEDQLGGGPEGEMGEDSMGQNPAGPGESLSNRKEGKHRFRRATLEPRRDPKLYDYE